MVIPQLRQFAWTFPELVGSLRRLRGRLRKWRAPRSTAVGRALVDGR